MKTIIIPADLTDNFYNCLSFALMIEHSMPIDCLMLFENKKFEKDYLLKFEELVVNFQSAFQHHESILRFHISTGKIEDEICMLIDENKDSIFLRTYFDGENAKQNGYTKENVLKLMKLTAHNVLTFPDNKIPSKIKRIIFPIHHLSKVRHKVTLTAEIAKLFGSEIDVLCSIVTNQSTATKQCTLYSRQVTNHFRNVGIPTALHEIQGKSLSEAVLSYTEQNNGDLISIIKERNSGGVFGKSYLQEMVMNSTIPLLVIGPRKGRITASFKTSG